jgi:uncharacterized membrane protein YhiD involved in acid resistance
VSEDFFLFFEAFFGSALQLILALFLFLVASKQLDKSAVRQASSLTSQQSDKQLDKQAVRQASSQTSKQSDKSAVRQASSLTSQQSDKQSDKQAARHKKAVRQAR